VRPVKAPITLAALFRAGSSCRAAGQIIHLDEKAATDCVELHHVAGQGRRWILTGPGAASSHAAKGQPPPSARNAQASLSWRRHGVPEPSALP